MVTLPPNDEEPLERELGMLRKYAHAFFNGPWALAESEELLDEVREKVEAAVGSDNVNGMVNRLSEAAHSAYLAALGAALKERTGTGVFAEANALLVYISKKAEELQPDEHLPSVKALLDQLPPSSSPTMSQTEEAATDLTVRLIVWAVAVIESDGPVP